MKTKPGKRIALWIALIVAALFSGLPILWLVSSSLKSNANIFAVPPKLIDESFSFTAYKEVLSDPVKLRFFLNSYAIAGIVVVITLAIALLAAYSFSRFDFPGKKIINTIIISPDRHLCGVHTALCHTDADGLSEHPAQGAGRGRSY